MQLQSRVYKMDFSSQWKVWKTDISDKPVKNITIKKSEANVNFGRLEKNTTRGHTMPLIL